MRRHVTHDFRALPLLVMFSLSRILLQVKRSSNIMHAIVYLPLIHETSQDILLTLCGTPYNNILGIYTRFMH